MAPQTHSTLVGAVLQLVPLVLKLFVVVVVVVAAAVDGRGQA